jgi:hypothetical protein
MAPGRCVCGFKVCACTGAAAVASAASSTDMDKLAATATEGQIGAVNDESWVAVDLSDDLSADAGVAIEDRPVFRTEKIKGILLHPYRSVSVKPLLSYFVFSLAVMLSYFHSMLVFLLRRETGFFESPHPQQALLPCCIGRYTLHFLRIDRVTPTIHTPVQIWPAPKLVLVNQGQWFN